MQVRRVDRLGDADLLQEPNLQIRQIQFVPGHAMPRRNRMGMVVVVPAFAERDQGDPPQVAGIVLGAEASAAPHVRRGIDQPGRMQADDYPQRHDPQQHAQAAEDQGEQAQHRQRNPVPLAQQAVEAILEQVGSVLAHQRGVVMQRPAEDDPACMRPEPAMARRVGILVGIGVLVVAAMRRDPVDRSALQRQRAAEREKVLQPLGHLVAAVRVQAVVAHADAPAHRDPVDDRRDGQVGPRKEERRRDGSDMEERQNRERQHVQVAPVSKVDSVGPRNAHGVRSFPQGLSSTRIAVPAPARTLRSRQDSRYPTGYPSGGLGM